MKTRESGMPDEATWEGFFQPEEVRRRLGLMPQVRQVMDFGGGYGTFSLAAAGLTAGRVLGLDIEPAMIDRCRQRAAAAALAQARFELRDFVAEGTGLASGSADFGMLFKHPDSRSSAPPGFSGTAQILHISQVTASSLSRGGTWCRPE